MPPHFLGMVHRASGSGVDDVGGALVIEIERSPIERAPRYIDYFADERRGKGGIQTDRHSKQHEGQSGVLY